MDKPLIDILLATYNGSLFLAQQLDSLLNQTYDTIHIYIRDDGSKDNTVKILKDYKVRYPHKITIVEDIANDNRATGNFSILMNQSTAPYILFSDQDDIWDVDKVERLLNKMLETEKNHKGKPVFVFTDLRIIDAENNLKALSLWQKEKLNPKRTSLANLLTQNVANGCASMINRELLLLGKNIPKGAMLHDHWLILLASAAGAVDYLDEQTINHRIHSTNTSRAESEIRKERKKDVGSIVKGDNLNQYFSKIKFQAELILQRLSENNLLTLESKKMLEEFIHLKDYNFLKRKWMVLKNDFLKHTTGASLNWWLRI